MLGKNSRTPHAEMARCGWACVLAGIPTCRTLPGPSGLLSWGSSRPCGGYGHGQGDFLGWLIGTALEERRRSFESTRNSLVRDVLGSLRSYRPDGSNESSLGWTSAPHPALVPVCDRCAPHHQPSHCSPATRPFPRSQPIGNFPHPACFDRLDLSLLPAVDRRPRGLRYG